MSRLAEASTFGATGKLLWVLLRRWWPALLCLVWCAASSAPSRGGTSNDFSVTTWGAKEGAPSSASGIAQTSDGYLWLGHASGLFRFDGLSFRRVELPHDERVSSSSVYQLLAPDSGGLWIGFAFGGVAFLKDGKLTVYTERDGLPPGSVMSLALDRAGVLWASTTSGIARLEGSRWQAIGPEYRSSGTTALLMVDSIGTLWAVSKNKTLFLPDGEKLFQELAIVAPSDFHAIAESPTGEVWLVADGRPIKLQKNENPSGRAASSGSGLQFDRDGGMWVDTADGVRRIASPEGVTNVNLARGVSTAPADITLPTGVMGMLLDREGNIWTSGSTGVARFSQGKITRYLRGAKDFTGTPAALAAGDSGALWIGSRNYPLLRLQDGVVTRIAQKGHFSCVLRAEDGSMWFAGGEGLWKYASGRFERVPLPAGVADLEVQAMAVSRDGELWVSIVQRGVFRLASGTWTAYGDIDALPRLTAVTLSSDAAGRIWFGYTEGRVAVLDGSSVSVFVDQSRLPVGNVTALYGKRSRIWAGGEFGLALLDGSAFRAVTSDTGTALTSVTGIVETEDGDLWINSSAGIVHFSAVETRRIAHDASYRPRGEIFDVFDGVEGTSARLRPLPTAIEGTDGRLWFVTDAGLYAIDASRIHRNPLPPPVRIESMFAGQDSFEPSASVMLPKGTKSIRIGYVGLSLTRAERVRYRYRLEGGENADWQDAGGRREALLTDLSPGSYRFQVIAANNDGVWNEDGATLSFVIPPTFVQTGWFIALCVVGAALLVWIVVRMRVRQVSAQIRSRFAERISERERIARELHDTLLQGVQGLIYTFQAAANRIAPTDPTRKMLETALDRADALVAEGRDLVFDLRVSPNPSGDLAESLAATGGELAQDQTMTLRMSVEGVKRELQTSVKEEAYAIGREALLNASRHSQASSIEVQVVYTEGELRVRIRDDGVGVDASAIEAGRPGHWGLQGMRERALKIGAKLDIWSRVGSGTEIELTVPAKVAYRDQAQRSRWLQIRRMTGFKS